MAESIPINNAMSCRALVITCIAILRNPKADEKSLNFARTELIKLSDKMDTLREKLGDTIEI